MKNLEQNYHIQVENRMLGYLETLQFLSEQRASLARFGDGELKLTFDPDFQLGFQDNSLELRSSLRAVLETSEDSLLVGLPPILKSPHWQRVQAETYPELLKVLGNRERVFGNSFVTRGAAFKEHGLEVAEAWRQIWEQRKVWIVRGHRSRFELLPELFSNVKSVEEIISSPVNAYEELSRIEEKLEAIKSSDVVLIALGPAATVLAHQLHQNNIQAIDIGHIANSYNQAFKGGPKPEDLPRISPNL